MSPLDNLDPLIAHRSMLRWLGDRPEQTLRDQIAAMLAQQVAGTELRWVRVIGEPRFLTVGDRDSADGALHVEAAAVAFAFSLMAVPPHREEWDLHGVATMLGVGLGDPSTNRYRFFLEMDGDLEALSSDGILGERLREFAR